MAKDPNEKKRIHKNSLANLTPGVPGKKMTSKDSFSKAFKEDIYKFWTTPADNTTKPRTKGQKLIADAAANKPEQFLKTVTGLLPREVDPDAAKKDTGLSDFANMLMTIQKKMGNKRAEVEDEEIIDVKDEPVKPFLTEGSLPVTLEDDDAKDI